MTSSRPSSATVRDTIASMLATSPQSASMAIARRALPAACSAVRCAAARSISVAATEAPDSAMARAVARPIPVPAPVTSTTLSCKIDMSSLPRLRNFFRKARQMVGGIAEQMLDHHAAPEVMADRIFLGHADAAMQLDRVLRNEFARLPDTHFRHRD